MSLKWPDDYINKVICGDCLEVMKGIPDGSVDLVVTDPPYGVTACDWDQPIDLANMWRHVKRIGAPNCACIITSIQPFTTDLINSNRDWFAYEWIWEKTKGSGHMDANRKPMRIHENICVFTKKGYPRYQPQGLIEGTYKTGRDVNVEGKVYHQYGNHGTSKFGNFPKSIIKIPNPSGINHPHPTQKPVALMAYLLKTHGTIGDIILDPFAGSGTTCVAAKQLGRKYIGIEIDPDYCKTAEDRLRQGELF